MAEYKAFAEGVEVRSEVILSFVEVMGAFRRLAESILQEHGIPDLQPDAWYPQQAWLDSFKAITERIGVKTLYVMARQIPISASISPEIDSLEKAFFELDKAYRESHRGGDVGHYIFVKTGDRTGQVKTLNPYPCDFDRGLLDSLARRFEPDNPYLEVTHLDSAPCKQRGAESCTFNLCW